MCSVQVPTCWWDATGVSSLSWLVALPFAWLGMSLCVDSLVGPQNPLLLVAHHLMIGVNS